MTGYYPIVRRHLWQQQNGQCFYCKRAVPWLESTLDHKLPRSKGGATKGNSVMACFQCNNRKGDLTAEQFIALGYDPRTDTDPRPRLSEARMEMWRKADAQRITPNLQPRSGAEVKR